MKKFSVILIICLFIAFTCVIFFTKNTVQVIKVYSPADIALDLNKNGKVEANEKFVVNDVETFTSKVSDYQKSYAESLDIDEETALAIGYFAEKYDQSLLEDKKVTYKTLENNHIIVNFNGKNYNKIIKNSPFALSDGKPVNPKAFEKQIQLAKSSKLRIYNNKSNKYHRLNCKYGQLAHDSVILPKNQIPKNAQSCKICENVIKQDKKKNYDEKIEKEIEQLRKVQPQKFAASNEYIKLYLTDLTTVFMPHNKCTTDYCIELVHSINNAQNSIDMDLYGYTDIPEITTSIQSAIRRGVNVRLVHDVNSDGTNFYPDTFKFAQTLSESKADYGDSQYQSAIMHNKFIVIDKKFVITGSANISTTDISGFNTNDIIFINSPEIANIYEEEFEQMYNNKFHRKKSKIKNKENLLLGDSIVSVYFSPQDDTINSAIIPLINSAKQYIYVPMFVITHRKVSQALADAYARGVDVRLILDATNANNKYTTHEALRKAGVLVKTENYAGKMHSKSLIIDDKYIITGSMNLSKSGNSKNDENVLIIENPALAKYYKSFFLYLWQKIPNIWLTKNAASESYDSIGSCYDGIDNDFDGNIDSEDSGCFTPVKNVK
ncbi:DUF1669 domain-containing protein [bacterium]|nr:DUF1669 domain-containing protein [bacterium]